MKLSKITHTIKASHPRNPSTLTSVDARLDLVVDEYILPNVSAHAMTIVFTHGTSFSKNLWDPTISRLLSLLDSKVPVKRIFTLDATNHAQSWSRNAGRLTNICEFACTLHGKEDADEQLMSLAHWPDQSQDILVVLKHFQVQQPVIGVGHSFGGGILYATFP
jgi:pimeloyl-ACP methyl ester carboxylesterase